MGKFWQTSPSPNIWKEAVKGALFTHGMWEKGWENDPKAAVDALLKAEREWLKKRLIASLYKGNTLYTDFSEFTPKG